MCSYRQLLLWQQAHSLAGEIYQTTECLNVGQQCQLATSMREAALAVPVQIATHYSCDGPMLLRGVERARCALVHLQHLVYLARRLSYWPVSRATRIIRHLAALHRHLLAFLHSLKPYPGQYHP